MARLVRLIFFLLIFVLGLYFGILNSHNVQLNYYDGKAEAPLALVVVIAIMLGVLLGVIASLSVIVKSKRELARVRKKLGVTEKEISNLRSLPLKEKS